MPLRRSLLIPLIVACALFMENMDSTVIATSLPAIAADLEVNPLALKLALTAYLISLAVFIPISGWVADRYGSRTVFAWAIGVFMTGSLLSAASSTLPAFVGARFLQGIGGAMMVPVGRLVLMRSIPKSEYIAALSFLTMPALLGPIIGPALGGAITVFAHWRWIFLINIPISIVGLILVLRYIPNHREPSVPVFDLTGFMLAGAGLALLMLGLSSLGGHLMSVTSTLGVIGAGILLLSGYLVHARRTEHPVIDLRLLKLPTFRNGVVGGSLFRIGMGASPFLLPLLLQLGFGMDPLQSGLLTCAGAVGALFMKTMTLRILRRWGFRRVLLVNALAASVGLAVCAMFSAATPHVVIFLVLLVSGCLRSLQFTALQAIQFADTTQAAMSQATSLSSMSQRLAQSLGIAIGAYVLQLASDIGGHSEIVAADFVPAFLAMAAISAASILFHRRLAPGAGTELSGHRG